MMGVRGGLRGRQEEAQLAWSRWMGGHRAEPPARPWSPGRSEPAPGRGPQREASLHRKVFICRRLSLTLRRAHLPPGSCAARLLAEATPACASPVPAPCQLPPPPSLLPFFLLPPSSLHSHPSLPSPPSSLPLLSALIPPSSLLPLSNLQGRAVFLPAAGPPPFTRHGPVDTFSRLPCTMQPLWGSPGPQTLQLQLVGTRCPGGRRGRPGVGGAEGLPSVCPSARLPACLPSAVRLHRAAFHGPRLPRTEAGVGRCSRGGSVFPWRRGVLGDPRAVGHRSRLLGVRGRPGR